jgi:hypothetical protein
MVTRGGNPVEMRVPEEGRRGVDRDPSYVRTMSNSPSAASVGEAAARGPPHRKRKPQPSGPGGGHRAAAQIGAAAERARAYPLPRHERSRQTAIAERAALLAATAPEAATATPSSNAEDARAAAEVPRAPRSSAARGVASPPRSRAVRRSVLESVARCQSGAGWLRCRRSRAPDVAQPLRARACAVRSCPPNPPNRSVRTRRGFRVKRGQARGAGARGPDGTPPPRAARDPGGPEHRRGRLHARRAAAAGNNVGDRDRGLFRRALLRISIGF